MFDSLTMSANESRVYHVEHRAEGRTTVLARDILLVEPWVTLLRERGAGGEVVVLEARTGEIVIRVPIVAEGGDGRSI